jgi:heterodisulfide reductase subunit C
MDIIRFSNNNPQSASTEGQAPVDRFKKIIDHVARQRVDLCWHCWSCSNGCPFADHMDLLPNQVLRLVQLNQREAVLGCRTIWICVGCHTCSMQCPNAIDVAAVMDALRQMAIHDGITHAEKDIFKFHRYVYESIQKHGRLNKLEALSRFKIGSGRIFSDLQAGLKMLTRGKLDLRPHNIDDSQALAAIFDHYDERRRSFTTHE